MATVARARRWRLRLAAVLAPAGVVLMLASAFGVGESDPHPGPTGRLGAVGLLLTLLTLVTVGRAGRAARARPEGEAGRGPDGVPLGLQDELGGLQAAMVVLASLIMACLVLDMVVPVTNVPPLLLGLGFAIPLTATLVPLLWPDPRRRGRHSVPADAGTGAADRPAA